MNDITQKKPTKARIRLSAGKSKPFSFRTTPEKHEQILRVADLLSAGERKPLSMAETIEFAIDLVDTSLEGHAKTAAEVRRLLERSLGKKLEIHSAPPAKKK